MRYLTLELCKAHLVVSHDEDDQLIETYATSAENNIEHALECPLEDYEVDGKLPEDLVAAMLFRLSALYDSRIGMTAIGTKLNPNIIALIQPYKTYGYRRG